MKWRYEVTEGEELPWCYGAAFIRWENNTTVCYVLGWHFVVRYSRRFWIWVRRLGFDEEIRRGHDERVIATTAFNRGYDVGNANGYRFGLMDGRKQGWDGAFAQLDAVIPKR